MNKKRKPLCNHIRGVAVESKQTIFVMDSNPAYKGKTLDVNFEFCPKCGRQIFTNDVNELINNL